ncbi:MAG: sulfotransferase family 2 domain-containing protein [Acidimicrobiales bacterium]|nr:sulfotransferase family 2 domain-containing protein [Acidimicrobiales bacterium]RZV48595.1 MAG: hypothetical protein EX269_01095 [Acidimicrobiales bacterium]
MRRPGASVKRELLWTATSVRSGIMRAALANRTRADLQYSFRVSEQHTYLSVENPKTGSTSVQAALTALDRGELEFDPEESPHVEFRKRTEALVSGRRTGGVEALARAGYRIFTFIRNPYTRLLSNFHGIVVDGAPQKALVLEGLGRPTADLSVPVSFEEFISLVVSQSDEETDPHWRSQTAQILPGVIPYTFVGRFESLADDYEALLDHVDAGIRPTLPRFNRSRPGDGPAADAHFTPELIKAVNTRYEADFHNLGYAMASDSVGEEARRAFPTGLFPFPS